MAQLVQEGPNRSHWSSKGVQGLQNGEMLAPKMGQNCLPRVPKQVTMAPGGPQMAHVDPRGRQDDAGDLPEGSRELQEAPLDPPEAAKESP